MIPTAGDPEATATLRHRWDARYRETERQPEPPALLVENHHLLPAAGQALDLACGLGASALYLARRGLEVWAWDLSAVAIAALRDRARTEGLVLHAEVRDVQDRPPETDRFDLILVSHFLERSLCPAIAAALRPGGLLFYQTFTQEVVDARGPRSPAYRLERNELLRLFPGLTLRFYREDGPVGNPSLGTSDLAQLIGQRP